MLNIAVLYRRTKKQYDIDLKALFLPLCIILQMIRIGPSPGRLTKLENWLRIYRHMRRQPHTHTDRQAHTQTHRLTGDITMGMYYVVSKEHNTDVYQSTVAYFECMQPVSAELFT